MNKIDYLAERPTAVCDTECYRDYWSIGFMNVKTKKKVIYEVYEGHPLDRQAVAEILRNYRIITFNGNFYDKQMIALAMKGASNAVLKKANDDIISKTGPKLRPWQFENVYGVKMPAWFDHIDLFEVAPGVQVGLKKYGARMNMKRLQELPIHFDENIGAARRPLMRSYLGNDLDTTAALAEHCKSEMMLRNDLSSKYQIDLRSMSDAQIAEAIFKKEFRRITGRDLVKPTVRRGKFKYSPPEWLRFKTPEMQQHLREIMDIDFIIDADGRCRLPKALAGRLITIGNSTYKMGVGGLHSQEKKKHFVSTADLWAMDADVRGYYPLTMLACGFVPDAIGDVFVPIFKAFVENRDKAKALAKKYGKQGISDLELRYTRDAGGMKIINNGTFGKTGQPGSVLWGPKLMIHVTVTGQLMLLMLIEMLHLEGFDVMSANTDGIVTAVPKDRYADFSDIIMEWEIAAKYVMEVVNYKAIYWRDVNNYFAIKDNGKVKTKGIYSPASVADKHDPNGDICSEAAIAWVKDGVPIEKTVRECRDITKFIFVRNTEDGGYKDGEYLGKLVRWYHGQGVRTAIVKDDGSQVAGSMGSVACMDLPDEFPEDVDIQWYIREAWARVADTGLPGRDPNVKRREGYRYANLPERKTVHIVNLFTEKSLCDLEVDDPREPWDETSYVPEKVCKKCLQAAEWRGLKKVQERFKDDIPDFAEEM